MISFVHHPAIGNLLLFIRFNYFPNFKADGFSTELANSLLNGDVEITLAQQEGQEKQTSCVQEDASGRQEPPRHRRRMTPADYDFPPDMMKNLFKSV